MDIQFYKFQGTGNDFVLLDNRQGGLMLSQQEVANICDRRFGVGADGLMLLQEKTGYDFEMIYYNADGNLSSMCGNGGRCITAFAKLKGIISTKAHFLAVDGEHEAFIEGSERIFNVKLRMNDVQKIETKGKDLLINTGSPHYIKQISNVAEADVYTMGKEIRYSEDFKQNGINVNFIESTLEKGLFVRTYERGVEDETYSCGTGVTASVLAAHQMKIITAAPVEVKTLGGKLKVHFKETNAGYTDIFLEGPVKFVFEGIAYV